MKFRATLRNIRIVFLRADINIEDQVLGNRIEPDIQFDLTTIGCHRLSSVSIPPDRSSPDLALYLCTRRPAE